MDHKLIELLFKEYYPKGREVIRKEISRLHGDVGERSVSLGLYPSLDNFGLILLDGEPVAAVKVDYSEPCLVITYI